MAAGWIFYQKHEEKQQLIEVEHLIDSVKASIYESVKKNGSCVGKNGAREFKHDLGVLSVAGVARAEAIKHDKMVLRTGCKLVFKFKDDGVNPLLKSKVLVFDLFNNLEVKQGN